MLASLGRGHSPARRPRPIALTPAEAAALRARPRPRGRAVPARPLSAWLLAATLTLVAGCFAQSRSGTGEQSLVVDATAYNSVPEQSDDTPTLTASGARLRPGMKALAVSRDLVELGLDFGTRVRIEGLPGEWIVLDRMHRRWRRKIDLYMGTDVEAARAWGIRRVRIHWDAGS